MFQKWWQIQTALDRLRVCLNVKLIFFVSDFRTNWPVPTLSVSPRLPSSPLEVGPLNAARESGEALYVPPVGSGANRRSNLERFSHKIWHLAATDLMVFLKRNWSNVNYWGGWLKYWRGASSSFSGPMKSAPQTGLHHNSLVPTHRSCWVPCRPTMYVTWLCN